LSIEDRKEDAIPGNNRSRVRNGDATTLGFTIGDVKSDGG
jgi:hypothetical protein